MGTNTVTTKGGNISSDDSLDEYLTGSDGFPDFVNTDPQLDDTYALMNSSPAIDIGNPEGINFEEDLNDEPRIQGSGIDAGAYESSFNVSTNDLSDIGVTIYPNPFTDQINISDLNGIEVITLFDGAGKNLGDLDLQHIIRLNKDLPAGNYFLRLTVDGNFYVKKLNKIN